VGEILVGRGIDLVLSSDLQRASETAELVAARLGLPVELDPRLREVDVGEWSGLTSAEVEERFPEGYRQRREGRTGWVDGEELGAMAERVVAALLDLAGQHPGLLLLVVTHGGPIRAMLAACGLESRAQTTDRIGAADQTVARY